MIIVTNAAGQLCNRLLLLAHAYATGLETNQKTVHLVAADIRKDIRLAGRSLRILDLTTKQFYNNYEKVMSRLYGANFRTRNKGKIEKKKVAMSGRGIHILDNWYYRDYESLFKHREEICLAFSPVKEHGKKVDAFVADIRKKYSEYALVGVHIRRGDYKFWRDGKFYFDNETFNRWMTELQESTNQKLCFLLFSNEPIAAAEFSNGSINILKGPDHPILDLYVMAQCDYIMGPPSSYSWWAAFYGGKKYLTMYSRDQHICAEDFRAVKGEEFNPEYYGKDTKK